MRINPKKGFITPMSYWWCSPSWA